MTSQSIRSAASRAAPGRVRPSRSARAGSAQGASHAGQPSTAAPELPQAPLEVAKDIRADVPVARPAPPPDTTAPREPALPTWSEWVAFSTLMPARGLRPWTSWGARSSHNAMLSAALLPTATTPLQALQELMELQQASQQQALRLQQQWLRRWATLWQEHRQMRQPNTVSKWMEEHFNLAAQTLDLLGQQACELANLEENVGVNYGYWVQQRLVVARHGN